MITFTISLMGCPAISLPCGYTRDGLPVGLQIVVRPRSEARLLGFAAHVETILGRMGAAPVDNCIRSMT